MFNLGVARLRERQQAEADVLRRRQGEHVTPGQKERRIMRIYGKTRCVVVVSCFGGSPAHWWWGQ